jgi:hypothetical protein
MRNSHGMAEREGMTSQHSDTYYQLSKGIMDAKRMQKLDTNQIWNDEVDEAQKFALRATIDDTYVNQPHLGLTEDDLNALHALIEQDIEL